MGGGGKIKAVFHRLNALASLDGITPVLLNLDHRPNQKINFARLQQAGVLAPGVAYMSLPDACKNAAVAAGIAPYDGFPAFDQTQIKGNRTLYLQNGQAVMEDRTKPTPIGEITKRTLPQSADSCLYTLIDGHLQQKTTRVDADTIETIDYVQSLPIRWTKTHKGQFVIGRNLVTDTICRMERIYGQNLFQMVDWDGAVVFFDGVTSAYLSPVTKAARVLFLHADHRGPDGKIVPRSKYLIENFKGEAIVTSTDVHKAQIEADLTPAAPVHVIPHFCDTSPVQRTARRHLVTVSRFELTGKPIPECIEAFCRIMDDYPQVDYLIYGSGSGQQALEEQIERLGCGDRVKLAGYTTDPLGVFRGALASVYPTTTEGFGLSILEALSNGCPVLTYDVNYGPREMITSGLNGERVAVGDIEAIAQAMRRILSDPARYQRNTNHKLERYSHAAYLSNYGNLVRQLAQQSMK